MGMAFMVFAVLFLEAFVLVSLVLTCLVLCFAINRIWNPATRKYGTIILVAGGSGAALLLALCLILGAPKAIYIYSSCFFMGFGWPGIFAYLVVDVLLHRRGLLQKTDLSKRRVLATLNISIVCCLVVLHFAAVIFMMAGPPKDDWSTDPPAPESIAETNEIRRERGVREIKEDWTFYGRHFGAEIWKEPSGRSCKNVQHDKSYHEIWIEYDHYYSGRTFLSYPDRELTLRETLFIHYFYGPDRFSINVRTDNKQIESMVDGLKEGMRYPNPDGEYLGYGRMGKTNEETLEVAEKILKMWGIERL
ncbi:MAG: hypothetical protein ACYTBZ_26855 [Planctomycetota bacterium]|jgi:hypothetical protein